jgi:putative membrane protein
MLDRLAVPAILALTFAYAVGVRRVWAVAGPYRLVSRTQALCFAGAIATLLVALASPLDAAVDHDLPLHMVQHVLLLAVVPPLLAESAPLTAVSYALPDGWRWRVQPAMRRVMRSQASGPGWLA